MAKKAKPFDHVLEVKFGTESCNGTTAQIGVTFQRMEITRAIADKVLCGAQLEVDMRCDPNADEDAKGQKTMGDTSELVLDGTPTCLSYHVYSDRYRATLVFPANAVAVDMLARFANHSGKLSCTRVGDAKTRDPDPDDEED